MKRVVVIFEGGRLHFFMGFFMFFFFWKNNLQGHELGRKIKPKLWQSKSLQ